MTINAEYTILVAFIIIQAIKVMLMPLVMIE